MYKGSRGFILKNADTPSGFKIRNMQDIETALYAYPVFHTVGNGFLLKAIEQAIADRKEYKDITEFANYLAAHYI